MKREKVFCLSTNVSYLSNCETISGSLITTAQERRSRVDFGTAFHESIRRILDQRPSALRKSQRSNSYA
jgi:hypothetical protein